MAEHTEQPLYPYSPSKAAGIGSAIVFTILLVVHIIRLFRTKTWFCTPFVIGAAFEVLGFAARAYGHDHPSEMNPVIAQALLILLAPILFVASAYMFLGRIIFASGNPKLSIIKTTRLTKIFVGGDILCFLIQGAGAGILTRAKEEKDSNLGKVIVLVGLFLQLILFAFFVVVAAVFHVRAVNVVVDQTTSIRFRWQRFINMLYAFSVIMTIRNVFRVAEYMGGEDGYLLTNEWPLYAFDALPMAIVLVICAAWYVGDIKTAVSPLSTEEGHAMTNPLSR